MVFNSTQDKLLLESLINRQYVDALGFRGLIISANYITHNDQCEVSIRFNDNSYLLETRFNAQYWFDNTKKPPTVNKRKIVYQKKELQWNSTAL